MRLEATVPLLVLTAISVNLELVLLINGLGRGQSALATATVLLAFHLGYLAAGHLLGVKSRILVAAALIGTVGTLIGLLTGSLLISVPLVMVLSSTLQALRRQLKAQGRPQSSVKNATKCAAMMIAGLAISATGLLVVGLAWLAGITLFAHFARPVVVPATSSEAAPGRPNESRLLLATEWLHHAHYFTYCYTFWRLIPALPVGAVGVLFSIGWAAYFVAEVMVGRTRHFSMVILAFGHLVCAACLFAMAAATTLAPMMFLWFVTGVGGGTAYMLNNGPQVRGRERAEDLGHATGTMAGGTLATMVGAKAALDWAAYLAIATACTAIVVHFYLKKTRRRHVCV